MTTEDNAQGVEVVFDANHNPISNDQAALLLEQKKFMLSVLELSTQTQNGKSIVCKHRDDMDDQAAWVEICEVYETSVQASAEAADLISYITMARLGDGKWKSGCENFIIHWDKTCDDYDNLCDTGEQLGKGQRKTMLQNAVSDIDDLCAVKVTQDQLHTGTATGTSPVQSYNEYLALLKSAAIDYDRKHGKFQKAKTRQVYQADFVYGCIDGFDDNDPHDIDTPVLDLLQAYQTDVKMFVPESVFRKLSAEDKSHWFKMSQAYTVKIKNFTLQKLRK